MLNPIVIAENDWAKVQDLFFNSNGKWVPEVAVVESNPGGNFRVYIFDDKVEIFMDLIQEAGVNCHQEISTEDDFNRLWKRATKQETAKS